MAEFSDAATARVSVRRQGATLRLVVEDDGRGFDYAALQADTRRERGFGLSGLAERVRLLGGTFRIESAPGHGTRLTVELPLPSSHEHESSQPADRNAVGRFPEAGDEELLAGPARNF